MFDERNEVQAIVFSTNHIPGQPTKTAVSDGDSVSLRKDDEYVLVKSVIAVGSSRFTGIIYGFEPSYEVEYQGLNLGDEVEFEEKHIIACSE
ncbi:MAG: hypothetical protein WCH04_03655 [Gammaproteobacteria bacterium]